MSNLEDVNQLLNSAEVDFGSVLRSERERLGLSISEVSKELHLEEKMTYALENHNLNDLPQPTYVCGYIRNYARFVGIDPDPLVNHYKQQVSLKAELSPVNSISHLIENKQKTHAYLFIIFLVIFLLIGGIYGWNLIEKNIVKKTPNKIETSKLEDLKLMEKPLEKNYKMNKFNSPFVAKDSKEISKDSKKNELDKKIANKSTITDVNQLQTDMIPADLNSQLDEILEKSHENEKPLNEVRSKNINQSAESLSRDIRAKPFNQEQLLDQEKILDKEFLDKERNSLSEIKDLKLKFNKSSWISIKDANNKSLIYDLMRQGEEIKLSGIAPIKVFLGDATGVILTVDDKQFDISGYINDKNIAKFDIN